MVITNLIKHKKIIGIALVLIVISVLAWRLWPSSKLPQADVPNDNPNNDPTPEELSEANKIARALYTALDGFELIPWTRDISAFEKMAALSDRVFVLSYNRFNELYGSQGNGTLRQWIKDDGWAPDDEKFILDIVFPRMDRLNLA